MLAGGQPRTKNAAIAQIWLDVAAYGLAPHFIKVDTACNLADGPTRDDLSLMRRLNAIWVDPKWPAWAGDLWILEI